VQRRGRRRAHRLDEAGLKRAITRLRGNIDDQVRTIERYLGTPRKDMADD
jgi:hypothetical protein